jgi:type II secretory pathway component PulJ
MKASVSKWTSRRGVTMVELIVSTAVTSLLAAGMMVGIVTVQRSSKAAQHHAKSQVEQARLLDYVCRDLRRALTVAVDTYKGSQRIKITIPDFYETDGKPRDPVISNGTVFYGDKANPVRVSYYKSGSVIYRSVNDAPYALATDVEDFVPGFTDDGKQVVGVSVSFVPRFQLNQRDVSGLRLGTAAYAKTLLRNKRHQ